MARRSLFCPGKLYFSSFGIRKTTEPCKNGKFIVHVEKIAVFAHDVFNFEGPMYLGSWFKEVMDFSLFSYPGHIITNGAFIDFAKQKNYGHDLLCCQSRASLIFLKVQIMNVHAKKSHSSNHVSIWISFSAFTLFLGNFFINSNAFSKNVGKRIRSILADLGFLFIKCSSFLSYYFIILYNSGVRKLLFWKNTQINGVPYYLRKYFPFCSICLVSFSFFYSSKLNSVISPEAA